MRPYKLLVVDDEPDIRQLLRIFFERLGYAVTLAADGQFAVEQARRQPPDLIVMDIQMPRKSGLEAVRELRDDPRFASTPIFALTAYARVHAPAEIIRAGFDQAIFKPVDFSALQTTIERALRQRPR